MDPFRDVTDDAFFDTPETMGAACAAIIAAIISAAALGLDLDLG